MTVAWGKTPGGFDLLDRRTSFRCGVRYEMVDAKTTDQHITCNSIRQHRVLAGLTYCQNILDFSTVLVIRRSKTQVAWRLVAMGNVDPKSGGVSNVDGYSYGRQALDAKPDKSC